MIEYLDIVTPDDQIIGRASREQIYAEKHIHRIVHVLLFTQKNEIILQRRSATVKFCPLHWCSSAAEHVQSGETWEQGAIRECKEELDIYIVPKFAYKDLYDDGQGLIKLLTTFTATHDGPLNPSPREVESVKTFSISEIEKLLTGEEKIHPELAYILKKHYQ